MMNPEHKKYIEANIGRRSVSQIAADLKLKEKTVKKFLEKNRERKPQAAPSGEQKPPIDRKLAFLSVILIMALGFGVYANSLNNKFILDDDFLIKNNSSIKNWSCIGSVFTSDIAKGSGEKWNSYRPLQMMSYMFDYSIWRLNVAGYHLTNILLHVGAALCLYWFISILFGDGTLSLFTSLLFVASPVHTGAIDYISGRADPLALIFTLLCLIFYIKNLKEKNLILYILVLITYVFALLSRENSLILPVILLLYHYTFNERLRLKEFIPIPLLAIIYILTRMTILKPLLHNIAYNTTVFQRIPGLFVAVANYTRILFLPFNLHAEYGNGLFNLADPKAIAGIIILSALLICVFRVRKTARIVFFSLSWLLITILPQSNIYPLNAYMAEHWLYLPSVGFFLLLADALNYLYKQARFRMFAVIVVTGLSVFYSYLTIAQNNYWKDPVSFYEKTLKYTPDSPKVLTNLAVVYNNSGKKKEAVELYKKLLEKNPNDSQLYNNLGVISREMGKNEEAVSLFKKAAELDPNNPSAYLNLGSLYGEMNNNEEAISLLKKAIELNPNSYPGYFTLGNTYKNMDRQEDAIAAYNKAIELNPDYSDAYNNLGIIYGNLGKNETAVSLFKKAIESDPYSAKVYKNLAVAYYSEKEYGLAIKYYDRAIELGYKADPNFLSLLEPFRQKKTQ